ncbi:hypothetical protein A8B82_18900 [Sulfitobacter sp. EhC04]|uniref:hypothetical protein n=1 Tax=Sulfitobacter sp. EhC04 TaxID=1849168 RepID=UPI0007F3E6E2|nr:hypothetical protein [Sulfitobacter sp. EhC04]OAN74087.1 hypothetical protein A8B82_18900 [Sulfitobacter sp. EhC04]
MFQTIEEAYEQHARDVEFVSSTEAQATMAMVIDLLDEEISAGEAKSSRERAKTALNTLLKAYNQSPETTALSLEWFDKHFHYDGWSPTRLPNLSQKNVSRLSKARPRSHFPDDWRNRKTQTSKSAVRSVERPRIRTPQDSLFY